MGLSFCAAHFLHHCKENGVNFESTLQIGRQYCGFFSAEEKIKYGDFAEPFFHSLGAEKVESMDYSDYEQASIIHDMNLPISENLKERFSVVIDSGTLEHVFNYPVAIRNCMEMVKTGGHLILITPANNLFGHGFYQFSPELFFSLLSEQNGFAETQIFMLDDSLQWFKVKNPKNIKSRVDVCISKNRASYMFVVSKKMEPTQKELKALQSDYVNMWENTSSAPSQKSIKYAWLREIYKKNVPSKLRGLVRGFISEYKYKMAWKKLMYERVVFNSLKIRKYYGELPRR